MDGLDGLDGLDAKPYLFYSHALNRRQVCYVHLPPGYEEKGDRYPVVYLLHGRNGMELDWPMHGRAGETAADMARSGELRDVILVMPNDGGHGRGTFYANWYEGTGCKFEDYMIYDLIGYIDSTFRTIASREARAIAGDSMGGYGSFMLAWRHPDLFGAAASLSGNMQVMETLHPYETAPMFGPLNGPYARQYDLSVLSQAAVHASNRPAIYFDCGTDDFLFHTNLFFERHLLDIGYPHTFNRFEGDHNWAYWEQHLRDALAFFEAQFRQQEELCTSWQS